MTVSQLIAVLKTFPGEAEVETEGCDCTGDCAGVIIDNGVVLLIRSEGGYEDELAYGQRQMMYTQGPKHRLPNIIDFGNKRNENKIK